MKDKCFELYKELCLEQAAGAGSYAQGLIDLAKEIYCQTTGVDIAYFNICVEEIRETLRQVYPWGYDGDLWPAYRQHYSLLLDDLQKQVEKYL